jgi:hypothetical protein
MKKRFIKYPDDIMLSRLLSICENGIKERGKRLKRGGEASSQYFSPFLWQGKGARGIGCSTISKTKLI